MQYRLRIVWRALLAAFLLTALVGPATARAAENLPAENENPSATPPEPAPAHATVTPDDDGPAELSARSEPDPFRPPLTVNQLALAQPLFRGFRLPLGVVHPYAAVAVQYRSNVFYKTTRVDHASLEQIDLGLRWAWPLPPGAETDPTSTPLPPLVADYQATVEIFNRFHELNFIQHHALLEGHARTPTLGLDWRTRLDTFHDPETVELATLVNREIQTFAHGSEIGLFAPPPVGTVASTGRVGVAATVDQRRHHGTALNFAEYDAFGLNIAYEEPRWTPPGSDDPAVFKLAIRGIHHPTRVLNNLVQYQAVLKSGGLWADDHGDAGRNALTTGWDYEWAVGVAILDVQTFRAATGERRRDALLPVLAVQLDGDLNARQFLHFRLRFAHEPDQSFTSNYLRRTTLAAMLTQRLGESYEWEVRGTETWEDPSRGPTLAQFELFAEIRYYREFPNLYLGRHAPTFLRIETRQVETAQRNRTGVKTFGDTRITAGWAIVL